MILQLILFAGSALFLLGCVLSYAIQRGQNYWPKHGVKFVDTGNFLKRFITGDTVLIKPDLKAYEILKPHRFGGVTELWEPVLFVADLELLKNICVKDFDSFVDRRHFDLEKADPHMHVALMNQSGEGWKNLRSIMSPTFTTGKVKRMYPIFESSTTKLIKALTTEIQNSHQDNKDLEIRPFFMKVTLDVIASAAFGIHANVFEDPGSEFSEMGHRIQETFQGRNFWKMFFFTISPKLSKFFKIKLMDTTADNFLSRVIVDILRHRIKTGEIRDDFLQLMLEARQAQESGDKNGEGNSKMEITDDLIIAQALVFILGGFDTTEILFLWTIYALALNPEVQEKLYNEVKMAYDDNGGKFSYDIILNLKYLEMVIAESLRKFPPAVRADRVATRPYKIPGSDYVMPKGTVAIIPIYAVHHDPEYWPEPDKFDPERFTKENIAKRQPLSYLPFGHGPRFCIGNRFALIEAKSVIASLVLHFEFSPCQKTSIPPKYAGGGLLHPADSVWLNIRKRN